MTRVRRFAASMASGYVAMGANVVYTLVSVPLALYYLDKEEFGLWVLVLQIVGYLNLIDLGMSPAVARILGDYKDDPNGGDYGSVIKTSFAVATVQGLLVIFLGAVLAPVLVVAMDIPTPLRHDFVLLLLAQAVIQGVTMITRPISAPLWSHQRQDISNYGNIGLFVLLLPVLWIGFKTGCGIWSLLLANAFGFLFSQIFGLYAVLKLGLLPKVGCWGKIDRVRFREIFSFSRDVFLLALGSQIVSASQVIIVSRCLGLEMAAAWAVGTKMFLLAQQMVWRFFDYSAPALTEMFVRGEMARFRQRFSDLVVVTAGVAAFFGILGGFCNSDFVGVWTNQKVQWSQGYDVLMGVLLFVSSITRCHTGLVGLTKQIHGMRYIYLLEGTIFIVMAVWALRYFGIAGIIGASILANILCSGIYGFWRSSLLFRESFIEIAFRWIKGPLAFCCVMAVLSILFSQIIQDSISGMWRILFGGTVLAGLAFYFMWKLALPTHLKNEFSNKFSYFRASP